MPELPEVETIKNAIAKGIGKSRIEQVDVRNPHLRQPVPPDFATKIEGATIQRYRRIAKYIVIDLDNKLSLLWHMGMSGKIKLSDKPLTPYDKHDHIIIKTDNGYIVYNDPRRFGLLTYDSTEHLEQNPLLHHLGIDPFDVQLTDTYLFNCLQKKKSLPVKQALLDQQIIVGIGNIYASEILYDARINPLRKSESVKLSETGILLKSIRKVLTAAIAAGGSTLRDYKKPDGSLGYFQNKHCVYGKMGQKCPICTCDIKQTGGIRKVVLGGRSTFYCEKVQK
jgi:formamidopyrimidine-DNA glycosylase